MLEPRLTLTFNFDFDRHELELCGQIRSRDVDSKFCVDSDQKGNHSWVDSQKVFDPNFSVLPSESQNQFMNLIVV